MQYTRNGFVTSKRTGAGGDDIYQIKEEDLQYSCKQFLSGIIDKQTWSTN
jgi:hypothetical protein